MLQIKVLFVCLGNICRSPAGEGAFRKLVQEKNLESHFTIDSCGTGNWHIGELPDPRTRKISEKHGIVLTHRARQVQESDLKTFDYILAMDAKNKSDLLQMTSDPSLQKKIRLFREFETNPNDISVPDPYYGSEREFLEVQKIVERASEGFLEFLKETHPEILSE